MTTSAVAQPEAPYRVRFAYLARPRWSDAVFYTYAVLAVAFGVWRCSIVNWHTWLGPTALVVDVFGIVVFTLLLWQVRAPMTPLYRRADLTGHTVDCLIPTHTEPVDVIEPTVVGAMRIRGVRRVLVLANNYREDVRQMALRNGAEYHARNAMRHGKAGNLNAGLAHTDAEFVITLDADHIPHPHLLERTFGHFDDPRVALVQTPQSFYNTDCFAFRPIRGGLWGEGLMFYRNVQPSKNECNAAFYVGTSGVLRRSALDDLGGFAVGTVTEDIHTALRMHAQGWHTVFVPEPVAFGLEAASLREFHSQRRRWAVGSLQLLFRHPDSPLRRRGLNLRQRVHYLHATMVHLGGVQRLVQLSLPALALFTMTAPVTIPYGGFALIFLAYALVSWSLMMLYTGRSYHPIHSEAYDIASIPAQLAALVRLMRRERRYGAANKRANPSERTWVKLALWGLAGVCVAAIGYGSALIATGRGSGLVISSVAWSGVYLLWVGSLLGFLMRYERRPAPYHESLTGIAKYNWVMEQTVPQIEQARARLAAADATLAPLPVDAATPLAAGSAGTPPTAGAGTPPAVGAGTPPAVGAGTPLAAAGAGTSLAPRDTGTPLAAEQVAAEISR